MVEPSRLVRFGAFELDRALISAFAVLIAVGCGTSERDSPSSPSPAPQFSSCSSPRFTVRHTAIDTGTIAQIAATLEREHDRITADLGVTTMPTVTVTLYPSSEALRAAVAPLVGSIPSFATGLVTAVDAVHILSPSLLSVPFSMAVANVVHEFAHCVSMRLQPNLPNNPRWLWETVALYEAGQFVDPLSLTYLNGGPSATFQQLSSFDNTAIYSVGASFGQFIVETWGRDRFRALIQANGNVMTVLGVTESEFIDGWLRYARVTR